jgi:hypothetical protein
MGSFELAIVGSAERKATALGEVPIVIGRSPTADVVLADVRVSWAHARLWVSDGVPRVADRGSRNGTFVAGCRVLGARDLGAGEVIDVAGVARFVVRPTVTPPPPRSYLLVEDLSTGIRYPIRDGSFDLAQLLPTDAARSVIRIWGPAPSLVADGAERPLAFDVPFAVDALRLVLRSVASVPVSTQGGSSDNLLPYTIIVSLARSHAAIEGPGGNLACEIPGDVGAALVYVLARALATDAPLPENERGWRADEDIAGLVWGRAARETALNRLKVTLFRLRQRLSSCGVDTDLLERANGRTRLRAARVRLLG